MLQPAEKPPVQPYPSSSIAWWLWPSSSASLDIDLLPVARGGAPLDWGTDEGEGHPREGEGRGGEEEWRGGGGTSLFNTNTYLITKPLQTISTQWTALPFLLWQRQWRQKTRMLTLPPPHPHMWRKEKENVCQRGSWETLTHNAPPTPAPGPGWWAHTTIVVFMTRPHCDQSITLAATLWVVTRVYRSSNLHRITSHLYVPQHTQRADWYSWQDTRQQSTNLGHSLWLNVGGELPWGSCAV